MLDIPRILEKEFKLTTEHTRNILKLFHEKATVPFIARYRKDLTGNCDEVVLRNFSERFSYLVGLEERKNTVLKTIAEQGKLTPELQGKIEQCLFSVELEDLYLPFKPKRRTRATVAREKGLQALADEIKALTDPAADLQAMAVGYVSADRGVLNAEEALAGASDIIAEEVSEKPEHRDFVRKFFFENGRFHSRPRVGFEGKKTKFEMYYHFEAPVKSISSHNLLAIMRGEAEEVLAMQLVVDKAPILQELWRKEVRLAQGPAADFLKNACDDAYERLMRASLSADVRVSCKEAADGVAISIFEKNLRELLLSPPAGMRPVLAIDPGFVTGCKVTALDETGRFREYQTIFPNPPQNQREKSGRAVVEMCKKHKIELIAVGNGTAGRETETFVREVLEASREELKPLPVCVIVNESGASVYSASPLAAEEFPDQDVTVRGAISIGRRLQDPLAELVKIDPKSIGVGQYQHDVDQKKLKEKLEDVVESCVNYVGVELNLASKELLSHVSGINARAARDLVAYRQTHGSFKSRQELMQVNNFGEKTFEQAAGFLRIRDAENPLDNTAIHPESYPIVEKMCADLKMTVCDCIRHPERLSGLKVSDYTGGVAGEVTVKDIMAELRKPTRDPRASFVYATFKDAVREIKDLKTGMKLEGVVTNVTRFGAFVDIGVHQDGLVHISQLSDRYVREPSDVVHVGQVVRVTVLETDPELKRISLSMKTKPELKK